jgi:hypothetical protein
MSIGKQYWKPQAEALKDMGKARVATGRVPIQFAIVKKPEMENWTMFNRSQFEAMLTLGKGADNYIVCHKVETQKDMGKKMWAKPNDQGCPTDDRLCDFPCKLAHGNKDERQSKELWNLQGSTGRVVTSWETVVYWRYMPYDSRPHKRNFRNEKDHGYIVGYVLSEGFAKTEWFPELSG